MRDLNKDLVKRIMTDHHKDMVNRKTTDFDKERKTAQAYSMVQLKTYQYPSAKI